MTKAGAPREFMKTKKTREERLTAMKNVTRAVLRKNRDQLLTALRQGNGGSAKASATQMIIDQLEGDVDVQEALEMEKAIEEELARIEKEYAATYESYGVDSEIEHYSQMC